jgi:2-polyprenyl-3-methyl-5-hydroxy-6-metoxy-1,4-benzoquinol methylase
MDDKWDVDVACNLCGSRDRREIREDKDWNYTFVECRPCGLMFYCPRFKEDYVIRTFLCSGNAEGEAENLFHNGVLVGKPYESPEKQKQILQEYYRYILGIQTEWFRKINGGREPHSMFEIGCSVGWYLKVARDEFLTRSSTFLTQGCDANRFAAETASTGFGIDVFGGVFRHYPSDRLRTDSFDLATALDYIEHTYTPRDDLARLYEMTVPGAVLVVKTFLHELDKAGAYVHPIFHAHHFTADTLRRTIESVGWRILEFDDQRERSLAQVTVFATRPT